MNCKDAQTALVKRLSGERDADRELELDRHIESCERCAARRELYQRVAEGVRALEVPAVSHELEEALTCAVAEGRKATKRPSAPPADPRLSASFRHKALVFTLVMLGLAVLYAALLLFASAHYEPPPEIAQITYRCGDLQICRPGVPTFENAPSRLRLTSDVILHTTQNALTKVETGAASWWMDRVTTVRFLDGHTAQLAEGRVMAECRGSPEAPVSLDTHIGSVVCAGGRFMARLHRLRLQVICLEGETDIALKDDRLTLHAGESAFAVLGTHLPPVRAARPEWASAWSKQFSSLQPEGLHAEAAALLPVRSRPPRLPLKLRLSRLSVNMQLSGPLALAAVTAELSNEGPESWSGSLDPSDVLWPAPICSAPSSEMELRPGERVQVECAALLAMCVVERAHYMSITPEGWSDEPVAHFSLSLQGEMPALSSATSPTHKLNWERRGNSVRANCEQRDLPAELPVLLRFESEQAPGGAVLLPSAAQQPIVGLVAAEAGVPPSKTVQEAPGFVLAFDASADYGTPSYSYAYQVAEEICLLLKPNAALQMTAWDGKVKQLPMRAGRHDLGAVERMLAALWALEQNPLPPTAPLLESLLRAGEPDVTVVAFLLTGCQPGESTITIAEPQGATRVVPIALQIGGQETSEPYRSACASRGGAAVSMPGDMSPEGAAVLAISNMAWPGFTNIEVSLGPGANVARVLTPPGTPSNQPVVAVVRFSPEAGKSDATFTLRTARTQSQAVVIRTFASTPPVQLKPALASSLQAKGWPGKGAARGLTGGRHVVDVSVGCVEGLFVL